MDNQLPIMNFGTKNQMGNYAALPGTGPACSICRHCAHLEPKGQKFVCGQFKKMTGREGGPIHTGTPACRYYQSKGSV